MHNDYILHLNSLFNLLLDKLPKDTIDDMKGLLEKYDVDVNPHLLLEEEVSREDRHEKEKSLNEVIDGVTK